MTDRKNKRINNAAVYYYYTNLPKPMKNNTKRKREREKEKECVFDSDARIIA